MKLHLAFLFFLFAFCSCHEAQKQTYPFGYDLLHPTETINLPNRLREISGIDVYRQDKIACVQDEKGNVYIYDIKKDEVKESVEFGKDHDYEAIANVNDTLYILQSNGNLFEIDNFDSTNQATYKYKYFLVKENNTEGLCYDKKNNRLLIACKGAPGKSKGKKARKLIGTKAIYAVDLSTHLINKEPAYIIDIDSVKNYISTYDIQKSFSEEMKEMVKPGKDDAPFAPSEIAIHPITHDIYVLCSVGKLLIVLNDDGFIQYITSLDPSIFRQPEGITFFENGDMLISDEAKGHHANILRFAYKKR